ncbi:MAG TPA: TetR/AcrR family transcriptional regulator [Microvirga sp.]|jgi:AcrR family transcriptional regulator
MNQVPKALHRQTRRFAQKREAILDAAVALFTQKGIRGATLADVAQSVGLITNSVTYYYRRKEDLASACYLRTIASLDALIAEALRESTPEARLARMVALYFDQRAAIARGEHPPMMSFADLRALTPPQVDTVFAAYTDLFRHLRELFQDPSLNLTRPEQNARTHLLISLVHTVRIWIERFEPEDYGRAAERMSGILLRGLAAEGSAWAPARLPAIAGPSANEVSPEAFLVAATRLINEQGYRGASVEKISARLQVTKGSFYHHNDNKDDLVAACFEHTFTLIRRVQDTAEAAERTGWDRLCAATDTLVRFQLSEHGPLLRQSAFSALPEGLRESIRQRWDRLSERFAGIIVDGMMDGSIHPTDPSMAAQLLHAMINAAVEIERWVPGVTPDTASDLFARPLFTGLLAR